VAEEMYLRLARKLADLRKDGTYKDLRYISSPVSGHTNVEDFGRVILMCSNNYLGLANEPGIVNAGIEALRKYGAGAASVRFICGTFDIHRMLEQKVADFFQTESAITYTSCMDANMSVIPALLEQGDTVISDELNHASIIDGCRLVKSGVDKSVYRHSDMDSLEDKIREAGNRGNKLIVTDGVFSMEGDIARLPEIVALSKKYNCLIMVDDSHGIGVMGKKGKGIAEHYGLMGDIDILTGTFGKALGGAGGGFVAGKKEIIDICIQQSRNQLFSNSLPPVLSGIGIASIDYLETHPELVESLRKKVNYLRCSLEKNGIRALEGESAIVPILVGETSEAIRIASEMLKNGVYVTGFGFPVVPEGKARIRLQVSDALSYEDIDKGIEVLLKVFSNGAGY
jgi:glycine C-acetyltransferase